MKEYPYGKLLLEFLNKDDLLLNRKSTFLDKLEKNFGHLRPHSEKVFDSLVELLNDNPQLIIDLTGNFLQSRESITKVFEAGRKVKGKKAKSQSTYPSKMDTISDLYELSSLFFLLAYLLSNKNLKLAQIDDNQAILKHFQKLGLSARDRDEIRSIRNAASHKFSLNSKYLQWNDIKIELTRINDLHKRFNDLMSWNLTVFVFALLSIPKFGILIVISVYTHMVKFNDEWIGYTEGLELFYSDLLAKVRKEKMEQKTKKQKNKSNTTIEALDPTKNGTKKNEAMRFIIENFDVILGRLNYHLNSIADILNELHRKIQSNDEKEVICNIENWLREKGDLLNEIVDFYEENPERVTKMMEKRMANKSVKKKRPEK